MRKHIKYTKIQASVQHGLYLFICEISSVNSKDRKSASGGVWMVGGHCIKTWSATQGFYALSIVEQTV